MRKLTLFLFCCCFPVVSFGNIYQENSNGSAGSIWGNPNTTNIHGDGNKVKTYYSYTQEVEVEEDPKEELSLIKPEVVPKVMLNKTSEVIKSSKELSSKWRTLIWILLIVFLAFVGALVAYLMCRDDEEVDEGENSDDAPVDAPQLNNSETPRRQKCFPLSPTLWQKAFPRN